jgi:Zn-finger nucleic acid-binding protein
MRCKFCSAPLPKKGLVCNYCGQRNPLNLSVLSKVNIEEKEAEHKCPVCDITCDNINIGIKERVIIQRCSDCDGVFISEEILEQLIQDQKLIREKIDLHTLRFIKDNPRQLRESVIRYKKCPVCDITMQRLNYRAVSGVIVDKCHKHGIWLDAGELMQLYEWKKAGGEIKEINQMKPELKSGAPFFQKPYEDKSRFDPLGDFFNWIQGA